MTYIWEEDTDLVKNIDGLKGPKDQFGAQYKTIALHGDLMTMHELLLGLVQVYSHIKPEGGTVKARPVYFVWRWKPEHNAPNDEVNCRLKVYTEDEYIRRNESLESKCFVMENELIGQDLIKLYMRVKALAGC